MSLTEKTQATDAKKKCRSCAELIPKEATLCSICKSQ
jgi:RNA polymerase subunit RPABC4/transcription elongation factor Spt4